MYSEKLKIEWNGEKVAAPNLSGLYWQPFTDWWEKFGLKMNGLLVGEEYPKGADLKEWFVKRYPEIDEVCISSLGNSDINWDITYSKRWLPYSPYQFIICQAVLEHVKNPILAVQNMGHLLNRQGMLYIHSHGPDFKEHRHPIDCYRFMRDGVLALAELSGLETVDILYTSSHWFLLLRKA